MGILLVVVGLLILAILLSRYTWVSKRVDRRSIRGHEETMGVLRSLGDAAPPPAPAGEKTAWASEPSEDIRIVGADQPGAQPTGTQPTGVDLPGYQPPKPLGWEPQAPPGLPVLPPSVAHAAEPVPEPEGSEVAATGPIPAGGDGEPIKPAFVFMADDAEDALPAEGSSLPPRPSLGDQGAPAWGSVHTGAGRGAWSSLSAWVRAPAAAVTRLGPDNPHRRRDLSVGFALVVVVIGGIAGGLWATSQNGQTVRTSQLTGASPTTTVPVTTPPPPPTTTTTPPTTTTTTPPTTYYSPPTTYQRIYSPPTTLAPPRRIFVPVTPPTTVKPPPTTVITQPPPTSPPSTSPPPTTTPTTSPTSSTPASKSSTPGTAGA